MKTLVAQWLDRIDWKMAIRTGIVATLSFIIGTATAHLGHRPDKMASGLWTTLTAVVVLQAYIGGTYKASWNRFLGVLIGSITGGLLTSLFGSGPLQLGFGVAFTVLLCGAVGLSESYRIASVSFAVICVMWAFSTQITPWVFSFYRFVDSCIGIALAVIIAHTVFPFQVTKKIRIDMADSVRKINQLYRMAFVLEPHQVPYRQLTGEIDDLLYANRQMLDLLKPELLMGSTAHDVWNIMLLQIENLYEAVVSLGDVYNEKIRTIFDDPLANHIMHVTDESNAGFREVALLIQNEEEIETSSELAKTLQELKNEQLRFRSTKATRQLGIEDLESFFVFFYGLKNVLEILQKIEAQALTLNKDK